MKTKWSKPSISNLNLCETKYGSCPAATGARHSVGNWQCEYYCSVCGGCKLYPFLQEKCLANVVSPIKHCENACSGGCKPEPAPTPSQS